MCICGGCMKEYYIYSDNLIAAHYKRDEHPRREDFYLHTHDRCELYCFLGGKGKFKVEGSSYPLHYGDILIMRPGEAHYIDIDLSVPYTRLAIHFETDLFDNFDINKELLRPFTDRDSGKFNLYGPSDFSNDNYKTYIKSLCSPAINRKLHTISNIIVMLNDICIAFENKKESIDEDTRIQKILTYINSRITQQISLDEICRQFYMSKSQLCRIFKICTGSTIHEYITAKRMVIAQSLMRSGQSPSKIYADCGYSDYSAFYRAYIKRFGISPNKTSK